jgi:hypothetical protein
MMICVWRDHGDDMSKQRDRVLNVLQSPPNFESTAKGNGKANEDIEVADAADPLWEAGKVATP